MSNHHLLFRIADRHGCSISRVLARCLCPGPLNFGIYVQAGNQPLEQVRPIGRCEFKGFGLQNVQTGGHVTLT